ncbi:hypothetical protein JTE90_004524 [Oedothorax gibbosus]|uniref:Uncharacterized protein n=1 Tax=Oedothorax gibbosus TaxID=931172 RepID=A0AAV6VE86_9ARAC|nr:hypothetical protein JTE90_004524 [Oedothorax gibbosus]
MRADKTCPAHRGTPGYYIVALFSSFSETGFLRGTPRYHDTPLLNFIYLTGGLFPQERKQVSCVLKPEDWIGSVSNMDAFIRSLQYIDPIANTIPPIAEEVSDE